MTTFEWDDEKELRNIAKHGVDFVTAAAVFLDPLVLIRFQQVVDGEERWQAIGTVEGRTILLVAHTYRGIDDEEEVIRIISARKASPSESRRYRQTE